MNHVTRVSPAGPCKMGRERTTRLAMPDVEPAVRPRKGGLYRGEMDLPYTES
jgi:hypothetical protein